MADAAWWDPANQQGGSPIVRHAPTQNQYHRVDERQRGHMPTGRIEPLVVPQATRDGGSSAFDANEPAVVHVDPEAPDGGVIVDMANLDRGAMRRALAESSYPHEVYYKIGQAALARPAETAAPGPDRNNTLLPPSSYIVPKAGTDGAPVRSVQEPAMLPKIPRSAHPSIVNRDTQPAPAPAPSMLVNGPALQAAPYPYPPPPQAQYQPPTTSGPDPVVMEMFGRIGQTLDHVVNRLMALEQRPPEPVAPPASSLRERMTTHPAESNRMPAPATGEFSEAVAKAIPRRPPSALGRGDAASPDAAAPAGDVEAEPENPFASLRIPYVTSPVALKPQRVVIFEFPKHGQVMQRYHDVVVNENNLDLIYDTRYEDGTMYLPPDLKDEAIRVHVPHLKRTFNVCSMGFRSHLGALDTTVLVKQSEEELDYTEGK